MEIQTPTHKKIKYKKFHKTRCLTKCRRVGLIENTVEIKIVGYDSDYYYVDKASRKKIESGSPPVDTTKKITGSPIIA